MKLLRCVLNIVVGTILLLVLSTCSKQQYPIIKVDLFGISDKGIYLGQSFDSFNVADFVYHDSCLCYEYLKKPWNEYFTTMSLMVVDKQVVGVFLTDPILDSDETYREHAVKLAGVLSKRYGQYEGIYPFTLTHYREVRYDAPFIYWRNDALGSARLIFTPDEYMEKRGKQVAYFEIGLFVSSEPIVGVQSHEWNGKSLGLDSTL